jgi:hypothetical protein
MQPCERRRAKQALKGPSGRNFFSKFISPAALRQDNQHQKPKAPQTKGKSVHHPVQQNLSKREFQNPGLSVQVISSFNNNTVAAVVRQFMIDISGAVSEEKKVLVITKMILNAEKWLLVFIGRSKS